MNLTSDAKRRDLGWRSGLRGSAVQKRPAKNRLAEDGLKMNQSRQPFPASDLPF